MRKKLNLIALTDLVMYGIRVMAKLHGVTNQVEPDKV